jgi:hypothetical protein
MMLLEDCREAWLVSVTLLAGVGHVDAGIACAVRSTRRSPVPNALNSTNATRESFASGLTAIGASLQTKRGDASRIAQARHDHGSSGTLIVIPGTPI